MLAIGRKEQWTLAETTRVTLISGLAHALSTVVIGMVIAFVGVSLSSAIESFTSVIAPCMLTALGLFYIYQHSRHHHFHLHGHPEQAANRKVIFTLVAAMFFSPCFEVEAYFLLAGPYGWSTVLLLAAMYTIVTVTGMVIWVRAAYSGLLRFNWHALEHNAGIITGVTLTATGIISFFLHQG